MPGRTLDELREERVVEALERIGTADAIKLLKEWAGNAKLRIAPSAGAAVRRLWKP